ncbi:TRAP transporter small permease [Jannaschia rubra]|uniref:TRAP transporter small permease n=1 Tax=Jannaschia rubra TaxID=282197 RepID=UPI0024924CD5|nr:TRAP transporter small permease [Jannaschia rubra]
MISRWIAALARLMAVLGGAVLTAMILLTCLSITGRFLNGVLQSPPLAGSALSEALLATGLGPIHGDLELVEAGMAFAVFAFLPITQLRGGHASVDALTARLGPRARRVLAALWAVLFAAVLILIGWQLWQGTQDKMRYGETTFLIQFPIWWAYAAALTGAIASAAVAVHVAVARLIEAATGFVILPPEGSAS